MITSGMFNATPKPSALKRFCQGFGAVLVIAAALVAMRWSWLAVVELNLWLHTQMTGGWANFVTVTLAVGTFVGLVKALGLTWPETTDSSYYC